eukprot:7861576-Pyramimonas_sp.AAC.1
MHIATSPVDTPASTANPTDAKSGTLAPVGAPASVLHRDITLPDGPRPPIDPSHDITQSHTHPD